MKKVNMGLDLAGKPCKCSGTQASGIKVTA